MHTDEELKHWERVQAVTKELRWILLGLYTPLTAVLPKKHYSNQDIAELIAGQLLFVLILREQISSKTLRQCEDWFREVIFFVLEETNKEDHVFGSIIKLCEQRESILSELCPVNKQPPDRPEVLTPMAVEVAVLELLNAKGMSERYRKAVEEAEKLAKSYRPF